MPKFNDIDLSRWKEYDHIRTDTLWQIDRRDNSGAHSGHYHGNFVPQIPRQLIERFTKRGEWVLDPFMGSGTTLIEARRLGRNSVGVDIQKSVVAEAFERINTEPSDEFSTVGFIADSRTLDFKAAFAKRGINSAQFVIFHPPYWDIIKFSDNPNDISNTASLDAFLSAFGEVIDNATAVLDKGRYCACVIGDKSAGGEIIPLGFYCMQLFLSRGFKLKATIVKNFDETKGKAGQQGIWRYRALASDFYIFKHEYVFVFRKG
jgi:DNA modification methylase